MLTKLIEDFIAEVCAGKTNETPAAYRSKLKHLFLYLGPDINNLNQETIDRFRTHLLNRKSKRVGGREVKQPLSRFTCRSILTTVRHFLRWSTEKGYLPEIRIKNIKEPTPDPKAVDEITVDKLLAAAGAFGQDWEKARNTALLYVLRDTGARAGAIAAMDLDNLYLEKGYGLSKTKGGQVCWLWFNRATVEALKIWLEYRARLDPRDYLLWTGARHNGVSRQAIGQILHRLAKQAGISARVNPHSFRHAFARDAILAGADLGQVADLLGHHGIVVTHKYYARWKTLELKQFHRKYSPGSRLKPPVNKTAKP